MDILGTLRDLALESGFAAFFTTAGGWKNFVMIIIGFVLLYFGIAKKFELFHRHGRERAVSPRTVVAVP